MIAFAGAANWPLWAGLERGLFARHGVALDHRLTPNSVAMAADLFSGEADLAFTSIDNVVAYDEGQGEVNLAGPADFVAVMGVDSGFLSLMAQPSITSVAALRGRDLAVDARTTGFAFVTRALIEAGGLAETDVDWVRVGGGAERLKALLDGRTTATILNCPLDLAAEQAGCARLARACDVLGAYQGIVAAVRRPWAAANRARVVSFVRGFRDAMAWLTDPANRRAAVDLLARRIPVLTGPLAETAYDILLDPATGMARDLAVDMAGVATVLDLRSRYARPGRTLADPARYVDDGFRREALSIR